MQLLAIKIGNTNIAFALYQEQEIVRTWRVETRADKTTDEYAGQLLELFEFQGAGVIQISNVAIVSVVPALTGVFVELARRYLATEAFVVAPGITTGIKIQYEDPRALGADRLVAIIAARARYGAPALVIDFGTATTFNAIDAAGDFIGGAIAPGLNIASQALHEFTAKLPRVDISPPPAALATNTRDALRSGLFIGYTGLVEVLVARLRADMQEPEARVIATGGLASLIAPHCPSIEIVDSQLAFEGLRILFEMNHTANRSQPTTDHR
ncbi:MAG: type III pantothenate kinase [Anaerolineae bacterium]